MDFLTNNVTLLAGGGISGLVLWLLKKIPNQDLYSWVETGTYWLGATMTLGLAKWRLTRRIWNKPVEPYFVDLIENTVGAGREGFIKGLRSDN